MTHIDAQPLQSCNQPTSCVTGCYLGGPTTPHRARARAKGRSSARAEQGGQGGRGGGGQGGQGGKGVGARAWATASEIGQPFCYGQLHGWRRLSNHAHYRHMSLWFYKCYLTISKSYINNCSIHNLLCFYYSFAISTIPVEVYDNEQIIKLVYSFQLSVRYEFMNIKILWHSCVRHQIAGKTNKQQQQQQQQKQQFSMYFGRN